MDTSSLLMLSGVAAPCTDCGAERIFVPSGETGEFCCTSCDAAVFLPDVVEPVVPARPERVA